MSISTSLGFVAEGGRHGRAAAVPNVPLNQKINSGLRAGMEQAGVQGAPRIEIFTDV